MIKAIFASDTAGGFGKADGMPWPPISEDFKHFKELTMGSYIVMGRTTWDSLPKLPGRIPVVVTARPIDGVLCIKPDNLVNWLLENNEKNIYIIGGRSVLTIEILELCAEIYHTEVCSCYTADTKLSNEVLEYLQQKQADIMLETPKCKIRRLY